MINNFFIFCSDNITDAEIGNAATETAKIFKNEALVRADRLEFLGDNYNIQEIIFNVMNYFLSIYLKNFPPVDVIGAVGDILGQQLAIICLLLILTISNLLLFISFLINIFLFLNKDKILNNKTIKKIKKILFFKLYINIQFFIIKISLI
jgi:hypothetical protein